MRQSVTSIWVFFNPPAAHSVGTNNVATLRFAKIDRGTFAQGRKRTERQAVSDKKALYTVIQPDVY